LIDGLGNSSTTRHFQNYFDELFKKLNLKLNLLYDVKINLKEYYPQDDILKVETLLEDQISVFFMVLDTNVTELLNSYNENQDCALHEQKIHNYSN
jgi:hypothetical protein